MSKHVMIDIESFSNDRNNPCVVSVGAVWFNPFNFDIGESLHVNLNAVGNGPPEYRTVKWWMAQDKEAQESLSTPTPINVKQGLKLLSDFTKEAEAIWANGINYDIQLLDSLYHNVGMSPSWGFRHMDMRSLGLIAGGLGFQWPDRPAELPAHSAVGDAKYQALVVQQVTQFFKERNV